MPPTLTPAIKEAAFMCSDLWEQKAGAGMQLPAVAGEAGARPHLGWRL